MSGEDTVMLSLQEALTMQLDEMELLETAYPEITFDTPDPRSSICAALAQVAPLDQQGRGFARQDSELEDALAGVALLSFRCPLSLEAQLRVRLPRRYPEEKLQATVEGTPRLSAVSRREIAVAANAAAAGVGGGGEGSGERRCEPQCLQVLSEAMRTSDDLGKAERESVGGTRVSSSLAAGESTAGGGSRVSATRGIGGREGEEESGGTLRGVRSKKDSKASGTLEQQHQHEHKQQQHQNQQQRQQRSARAPDAGEEGEETAAVLGRRLIYSHHIIASQKRTGVVKAARELGLGGFSKIGWPGVIVVEGEESSCEEFVSILRRWRWKHLAVRGEETLTVPKGATVNEERRLPLPFSELSEKEGVSAVAKRCRELGLGELFATLLR